MATVYRRPHGINATTSGDALDWVVARHRTVQAELAEVANRRAAIARAKLAAHRDTGASHIFVEHGDVDYYVGLYDAQAPMTIETGGEGGRGGVHALGTAFPETKIAKAGVRS